jgi:hypothetical protein
MSSSKLGQRSGFIVCVYEVFSAKLLRSSC